MHHRRWIQQTIIIAGLLLCSTSFASQEGIIALSNIAIQSKGIGSSGPIAITAKAGKNCTYSSFRISAFGKQYTLSKTERSKLNRCYNGIMLSYERGYKILGGKTLYINLLFGFNSGIRHKTRVVFKANGKLRIETKKK
jgi:hypothetical protein